MSLRVFEPRYVTMLAHCQQEKSTFGICLIAAGAETGEAAVPHLVGTEAHIERLEPGDQNTLLMTIRGGLRFQIKDHETEADGLLTATVHWLEEPPRQPIPKAQADLLPLLAAMAGELGDRLPSPRRFNDAAWVGARYSELLPIPLKARQRLLELDDVISRLEIIQQYLYQNGLLGKQNQAG